MNDASLTKTEAQIRNRLKNARRIVIKLGTSILLDQNGYPSRAHLNGLVSQVAHLHAEGREVIVVSSGAIGSGLKVLGIPKRPKNLPDLQMAASIGQSFLLSLYSSLFEEHKIHIGQVLLTHDDLRNRVRHLNARNAFLSLLKHRVIPIVNENDVVSVDEIRVGDNDVLASLVAMLTGADALILATTAEGFYRSDERGEKVVVPHITKVSEDHLLDARGKGSELSTGGMSTKLQAANNVAKIGGVSAIVDGRKANQIVDIFSGKPVGTVIGDPRSASAISKRKQWIAFFNRVQGSLVIDDGAAHALLNGKRSLLPAGIVAVKGHFGVGTLVQIEDKKGKAIAVGLCEYTSADIEQIKSHPSHEIGSILGKVHGDEVIHRDNIWTDL
jgi:glutamate 5-kinase